VLSKINYLIDIAEASTISYARGGVNDFLASLPVWLGCPTLGRLCQGWALQNSQKPESADAGSQQGPLSLPWAESKGLKKISPGAEALAGRRNEPESR
jgi:hypothetical protein